MPSATNEEHEVDEDADNGARGGSSTNASGVTVKPVSNAIRILRYLSQTAAPERATDIARHLQINPSTCFNILRTLVAEEVVEFNPVFKMYTVGLGLAKLANQVMTQGQRIELARPVMEDLAARYQVTTTLWRRMGLDRIVLVSSVASPAALRIDMPPGQRLPLLMGASGRLFIGQLGWSEEETRKEFESIHWSRPISFDTYWREVNRAKKRGWAQDDGYFSNGILAIAAPVYDPADTIAFTLSAVMIRGHYDDAGVDAIGEALRAAGTALTKTLF
ncbi:IclR family transcriptional regulator [Paucibacter sp. R3-3]|uniref:IclR family transcriptional regulator n=1 Tax=Roseateles agri TaxID=3098619 RepID=A0ABU5DR45_9BURK|nr:IclR family transcriptional regulator [Paucibacter sp. R3-3]MDY0748186.1 IclR family transcriptional regulator [Paucibacter sp. R3-3]